MSDEASKGLDRWVVDHLAPKSATLTTTIFPTPALNQGRKLMPKAAPTLTRNSPRLPADVELVVALETLRLGIPDRDPGLALVRPSWFGTDPRHLHRIQTHGKAFGSVSVVAVAAKNEIEFWSQIAFLVFYFLYFLFLLFLRFRSGAWKCEIISN